MKAFNLILTSSLMAVSLLAGCATRSYDDKQSIAVHAMRKGVDIQANCVVKTDRGDVAFKAPGSVNVLRQYEGSEFKCYAGDLFGKKYVDSTLNTSFTSGSGFRYPDKVIVEMN